MKNKLVLLLAFVFLLGMTAVAQDYPKFEVPVDFSFINVHPNAAGLTSFNFFGGGVGAVYNFSPIFGIKADFDGYTQGSGNHFTENGNVVNLSGNLFTYLFGPQIKKHSGTFQPFGEVLFGGGHINLNGNVFGNNGQLSGNGSANAFAMEFGGGLDMAISKSIQLRPVEVDYLYTHFGGEGQNNFKYCAGVNFTFGGK